MLAYRLCIIFCFLFREQCVAIHSARFLNSPNTYLFPSSMGLSRFGETRPMKWLFDIQWPLSFDTVYGKIIQTLNISHLFQAKSNEMKYLGFNIGGNIILSLSLMSGQCAAWFSWNGSFKSQLAISKTSTMHFLFSASNQCSCFNHGNICLLRIHRLPTFWLVKLIILRIMYYCID